MLRARFTPCGQAPLYSSAGLQIGLETSEARFDETAFSRIEKHLAGTDRNRAMQLNPVKSCAPTI